MATAINVEHLAPTFWNKVDMAADGGCWQWLRYRDRQGYGNVNNGVGQGNVLAHRVAWTLRHGVIAGDLTIDHICRNTSCVNPDHLRLMSRSENSAGNGFAVRSHCSHGHDYTPENTRLTVRKGLIYRSCRACDRRRSATCKSLRQGPMP